MPEYKSTISPIFCPVSISAPSLTAGKKKPPEWETINSSLFSLVNCNWYFVGFLRSFPNTPVHRRLFTKPEKRVYLKGQKDNLDLFNKIANTSFS